MRCTPKPSATASPPRARGIAAAAHATPLAARPHPQGGMKVVCVASRHAAFELSAADLVVRTVKDLTVMNLKNLFAREDEEERLREQARTPVEAPCIIPAAHFAACVPRSDCVGAALFSLFGLAQMRADLGADDDYVDSEDEDDEEQEEDVSPWKPAEQSQLYDVLNEPPSRS